MVRGQHKTFQDTNNVFITTTFWQDTKPVYFTLNFHKPHVTGTAVRRIGRRHIQVSIPHISKEYQKHYKVIDYFDQLAERYTFGSRCCRSWMYIFNWLFNADVVNSYILHGLSCTVRKKKKYVQIDFRHELALGLINNYSSRPITLQCKPVYISPDAPQTMVNHVNTCMNASCVQTCQGHRKFEGTNKRTIYGCAACNTFLCKSCHPKWYQAS